VNTETVIDVVVADAPPLERTVDDIVGMGQDVQRRHRTRGLAISACCVAVLAVSAVVAVPRMLHGSDGGAQPIHRAKAAVGTAPSTSPSAPPLAEPFSFTLQSYTRGSLRVDVPRTVSTAYQAAAVFSGSDLAGYLTVFRPGAFDSGVIAGRPTTTVSGRPGAQWSDQRKPEAPGDPAMTDRFLTWQYADDAWATLEIFSADAGVPSAADLRLLAEGLTFGTATPAKLPFKVTYVPAGYHPVIVGTHAWPGKDGLAVIDEDNPGGVVFARPAPKPVRLAGMWDQESPIDLPDNFDIAVAPDQPKSRPAAGNCAADHTFCVQWRDGGRFKLFVESRGHLSEQEMLKVLDGIELASVDDDSTWTDASQAIPVRP
jgi:hypothetical protein